MRLLSFRTGILKSICVKEMTLLLFSFQHSSLLTLHTDLHGHTAYVCICRSRPLQWCLMFLSRLSGCPKSSQRDAPSSGISLLRTKNNQQVLNLANTEGGWTQSLFVGPKTAWRLSRCGTGRVYIYIYSVCVCVCVCVFNKCTDYGSCKILMLFYPNIRNAWFVSEVTRLFTK